MRCLLCDRRKNASLWELFFSEDPLCLECRGGLSKKSIGFRFHGVWLRSDYVYDVAFSRLLKQFKEQKDEALKTVFLYGLKRKIWWRFEDTQSFLCLLENRKFKKGVFPR